MNPIDPKDILVSEGALNKAKFRSDKRAINRGSTPKLNHFKRTKQLAKESGKKRAKPIPLDVYFDSETLLIYEDINDPKRHPVVFPYHIGVCTSEPNSFKSFRIEEGSTKTPVEQLVDYLIEKNNGKMDVVKNGRKKKLEVKVINLHVFNIDYDFKAIRPELCDLRKDRFDIYYEMTQDKKFLSGGMRTKKNGLHLNVVFRDLWRWDVQKGLAGYIQYILDITYKDYTGAEEEKDKVYEVIRDPKYRHKDEDGNITWTKNPKTNDYYRDEIAVELDKTLKAWGYTRDSFKKGDLGEDYVKIDPYWENGKLYYYRTKEDAINKTNPQEMDWKKEHEYLKVDVEAMPIIHKEQQLCRQFVLALYGLISKADARKRSKIKDRELLAKIDHLKEVIDEDTTITFPSFCKYVMEEFLEEYLLENFRLGVPLAEYRKQDACFMGAFVGGNKNITYLDEEVFKKLYPNIPFYDEKGKPRIKSYDVNSMYPWVEVEGLPYGRCEFVKPPKGVPHATFYEIQFRDYWDPKNKVLYKWKREFAHLNNTFFGRNFERNLTPGYEDHNKWFIPDFIYKLFNKMCNHKAVIVRRRYVVLTPKIAPFVDILYRIKNDKENNAEGTVAKCKLGLNSGFGKFGEKSREVKIVWGSCNDALLAVHPEMFEAEEVKCPAHILKRLKEEKGNQWVKSNVAPFVDKESKEGFFFIPIEEGHYDEAGEEMRESIMSGLWITFRARWKLLSAVYEETKQGNVVLYCDTDSIKMIQIHPPKFEIDEGKLGAWKDEGSFTHFAHPNKHKKYFMHNKHETSKKKRWMVKVSGIDKEYLKKGKEWDLEQMKVIYDPKNCVVIKNAKITAACNEYYQTVLYNTDYKFAFEDPDLKPTHIFNKGVLTKIEEE